MSAISDRARDFWDRISPRERRLVVIAAIAVPITIAVWLGMAIHDGLDKMEARNDRTRRAIGYVEKLRSAGSAAPISADQDVLDKMGYEVLQLHTYLENAATKAGFVLKGTTPHNDVHRNGFVTSSYSCAVDKLTIEQLKNFLQEIEATRVVAVTHLDIRRDFRDKEKLDATLEVSTYAKEKAESAGSAAGSGKGS
jgi:hypothetical protein